MVLAGEGTPTQTVIFGLLWAASSLVMIVWPRQSLVAFERHRRWQRDSWSDWPVPQVRTKPKTPTDRAVAAYRIVGAAFLVISLIMTAQGITGL